MPDCRTSNVIPVRCTVRSSCSNSASSQIFNPNSSFAARTLTKADFMRRLNHRAMCHEQYHQWKFGCGAPAIKGTSKITACKNPGSSACKKQKKKPECLGTVEHTRCARCSTCRRASQKNVKATKAK